MSCLSFVCVSVDGSVGPRVASVESQLIRLQVHAVEPEDTPNQHDAPPPPHAHSLHIMAISYTVTFDQPILVGTNRNRSNEVNQEEDAIAITDLRGEEEADLNGKAFQRQKRMHI